MNVSALARPPLDTTSVMHYKKLQGASALQKATGREGTRITRWRLSCRTRLASAPSSNVPALAAGNLEPTAIKQTAGGKEIKSSTYYTHRCCCCCYCCCWTGETTHAPAATKRLEDPSTPLCRKAQKGKAPSFFLSPSSTSRISIGQLLAFQTRVTFGMMMTSSAAESHSRFTFGVSRARTVGAREQQRQQLCSTSASASNAFATTTTTTTTQPLVFEIRVPTIRKTRLL